MSKETSARIVERWLEELSPETLVLASTGDWAAFGRAIQSVAVSSLSAAQKRQITEAFREYFSDPKKAT